MALTATQKKQYVGIVERLVQHWQPILGLENIKLVIVANEDESDTRMSVGWVPGYRNATFTINTNIDWPEVHLRMDVIEHAVLHELSHLIMAPIQDFAYEEFDGQGMLWHKYRVAMESTTDTIAAIITRLGEKHVVGTARTGKLFATALRRKSIRGRKRG